MRSRMHLGPSEGRGGHRDARQNSEFFPTAGGIHTVVAPTSQTTIVGREKLQPGSKLVLSQQPLQYKHLPSKKSHATIRFEPLTGCFQRQSKKRDYFLNIDLCCTAVSLTPEIRAIGSRSPIWKELQISLETSGDDVYHLMPLLQVQA